MSGWEVEWCTSLPLDEHGDGDFDAIEWKRSNFATEAEAVAKAKAVLPLSPFGCVQVTPFRYERLCPEEPWPYCGPWTKEYTGDSVEVSEP